MITRLSQESNSPKEEMWLLGMAIITMTTYNSSYCILNSMPNILHIFLTLQLYQKHSITSYFKDKKSEHKIFFSKPASESKCKSDSKTFF